MKTLHSSTFLLLISTALPLVLSTQTPFQHSSTDTDEEARSREAYRFEWPVKRVAVIGAGVAGMTTYRELRRDGFDVHIFERDFLPGGNWHYTDEIPADAPVPNAPIAVADFEPSLPPHGVDLPYIEEYDNRTLCALHRREHRAPKPIWYGLTTNVPAPLQQIREFPWPDGTEWSTPQDKVCRYLRAFASWHNINTNDDSSDISYNTRVELIEKRLDADGNQIGWTLTTKELVQIEGGFNRATWNKRAFDGVVIASGRYNAPNVPPIAGLAEWGKVFPDGLIHSRQYRQPEMFAGRKVVVIGAAASGSQISREISPYADKIYQSVRPEYSMENPHPTQRPTIADWVRTIPQNVSIVAEIKRFHSPGSTIQQSAIELVDGTILTGIDHILFSTGYLYTYPFLPEYHDPSLGRTGEAPEDAPVKPIITDGSHIRSLHLDTFYIDNPTLAFVNANVGISAFTYAEFQALAISMVWSGKAHLPERDEMWRLYRERVKEIGYGKHFSFLGKRFGQMVRYFQGWLNAAAAKSGGRQINGFPFVDSEIASLWNRALFGDPWLVRNITIPGAEHIYASMVEPKDDAYMQDVLYNDIW
ncbi:Thiol-specific monooxygenase [Leucoagaricus sp. SymC.cos]|nr:Thiol-specific monooxygenase [Leucoagaricus sp. SymC.cos]